MTERQGVEIDYFPQCRGEWLDRRERDKLIERSMEQEVPSSEPRQSSYFNNADDDVGCVAASVAAGIRLRFGRAVGVAPATCSESTSTPCSR